MPSYILRGIDADLWRAFKAKAAMRGKSLKTIIEDWIRAWVAQP